MMCKMGGNYHMEFDPGWWPATATCRKQKVDCLGKDTKITKSFQITIAPKISENKSNEQSQASEQRSLKTTITRIVVQRREMKRTTDSRGNVFIAIFLNWDLKGLKD